MNGQRRIRARVSGIVRATEFALESQRLATDSGVHRKEGETMPAVQVRLVDSTSLHAYSICAGLRQIREFPCCPFMP